MTNNSSYSSKNNGLEMDDHSFGISLFWVLVTWKSNMFKDSSNLHLFRRHLK